MKTRLYLIALLAQCFSMTAVADPTTSKWAAPVKPIEPVRELFDGDWVTPEAGNTYYIYNVGAAQFMGCGREWGTRTIATVDSIVSPIGSIFAHATNKDAAIPYTISSVDDTEYIRFVPQNTDMSRYVSGLTGGNASWNDTNDSYAANWQLIPDDDSNFLLHDAKNAPYDPSAYIEDNPETEVDESASSDVNKYGLLAVDEIGTASYTWINAWAGANANGKTYKVAWKFIEATDDVARSIRVWRTETQATYDAEIRTYNAALAIYNAKVSLRDAMLTVDAAGIDVTAAEAVYFSETATVEDILSARTALLMAYKLTDFKDAPKEITEILYNPDFEMVTPNGKLPSGWDITITGQYVGQQNRKDMNPETGLTLSNFVEAWSPYPTSIGDGVIAQTVYGLPKGIYRLVCDASVCHDPANGDGSDIEGAGLFIKAGVLRTSTPIGTQRMYVTHFEVEFENDGRNAMQLGLFTESTNANWLSADNFQLWYVGPLTENPNYKNLQNYLAEIQDKYNNEGIGNAYLCTDSLTALDNAIEAAANISKTATDEELDAAYLLLEKAYNGAITSIKVYETLRSYTTYNEEGSKLAYYEEATAENGWNTLSQSIHELQECFNIAYKEGTWSDDEVTERISSSIVPMIRQWVSENNDAIKPGADLTLLLENADFSEGDYSAGWDAADDEIQPDKDYGTIPGWTISSGNISQMHGGVIETYHRKFDFNQTIKNMPVGVYEITVQGFVRHDGSATDQTIFYAGDLQTSLMLRSEQWSLEDIYDPERDGSPCGDVQGDQEITNSHGEKVKVPNGMSGFYFWSQVENVNGGTMDYLKWQEGDLYYTNHIKLTIAEPQDITIGVRSLINTDWVIWDNLQIKYLGSAPNELYFSKNNQPIEAGNSELFEIGLNTDYTNLVAFQMDLTLPEGVGIDKMGCSLSSRIKDEEQMLTIGKLESGAYRITSTSLSLIPISGDLGTLFSLKLTAEDGCVGGQATISNIIFSTPESEKIIMSDETFDISILYKVAYKVDGEEYQTDRFVYNTPTTLADIPVKEGYTFSGWSEIPETMPAHDVEVTGSFTINYYTLTYILDGEEYKTSTIAYGTAITAEDELSKEGYTFSGWSEIPETMPAHDVEITGSFSINHYTLTYRVDGEEYKTSTVAYGTDITAEEELVKEGYTFSGWSEIPVTMPAHDVEITGSFSINSYVLTYLLDDEEYKTSTVTYGTELTPESEPTEKEGYTFTGWSEIPETMPAHDVVVTGYFYPFGDVNTDEEVDVVDVVDIARFVVATPSNNFIEKLADINKDNTVNIADAVVLVNYIAGDQNFVKAKTPSSQCYDYSHCQLQLLSTGQDALSLCLNGEANFTAFQFDIDVPDNLDISAMRINGLRKDSHQLLYNKVADNRYRVAALSLTNATFKGNEGELLQISVNGQPTDDICVHDIHFVTTNGTDITFDSLALSGPATGIINTNVHEGNDVIYDLQGRKLSKVQRGVNIVNGKKVLVNK